MFRIRIQGSSGSGAALFGWSLSRFFGPAPAPAPTPTPTPILTHRTVNILFLRDPKYDDDDYDCDSDSDSDCDCDCGYGYG